MKEFKDWYENYGQYSVSMVAWFAALRWVKDELEATMDGGRGDSDVKMWRKISDILDEEK